MQRIFLAVFCLLSCSTGFSSEKPETSAEQLSQNLKALTLKPENPQKVEEKPQSRIPVRMAIGIDKDGNPLYVTIGYREQ